MLVYFLGDWYFFPQLEQDHENALISRADKEGEIRRDKNGTKTLWVRGFGEGILKSHDEEA